MGVIHLLDQGTINKIAAGEVVERPYSVVKELVENAMDAGATQISVEIKDGGVGYIRVTDNGRGIDPQEVRTAFLRHSTSKIRSVEDLQKTMTLGFRGEALASIAAVSRVEMITKQEKSLTGVRFVLEGGKEVLFQEVACQRGTTIRVENLFFNTPARLKFLKSHRAEAAAITDLMEKLALGHPEVSFRYLNGKSEPSLYTSGDGALKNPVFNVYGKEMLDMLLYVSEEIPLSEGGRLGLRGYLSRPQLTRSTRGYENFYVNGRFVKSALLEKALDEAYKDYIIPGQFPVAIMHLAIDPAIIDVNVHPTKMEIRFIQEDLVRELLIQAFEEALSKCDLVHREGEFFRQAASPVLSEPPAASEPSAVPEPPAHQKPWKRLMDKEEKESSFVVREAAEPYGISGSEKRESEVLVHEEKIVPPPSQEALLELEEEITSPQKSAHTGLRLIGQVFKTYWLMEEANLFYLVDQHAAHERVLYDRFRAFLREGQMDSQVLLDPVVCHVQPMIVHELDSYAPLLEKTGFQMEAFGEDAVLVRGVPFLFGKALAPEDLADMLDMLHEGAQDVARDLLIDKIAMMSCKAAVKGNDPMSPMEAQSLMEQLFASDNPYNCPHGRPTMISMTQYEIEKKFKRV